MQARGQELADMMGQWYKAQVGGDVGICVRVYYGAVERSETVASNSCESP